MLYSTVSGYSAVFWRRSKWKYNWRILPYFHCLPALLYRELQALRLIWSYVSLSVFPSQEAHVELIALRKKKEEEEKRREEMVSLTLTLWNSAASSSFLLPPSCSALCPSPLLPPSLLRKSKNSWLCRDARSGKRLQRRRQIHRMVLTTQTRLNWTTSLLCSSQGSTLTVEEVRGDRVGSAWRLVGPHLGTHECLNSVATGASHKSASLTHQPSKTVSYN